MPSAVSAGTQEGHPSLSLYGTTENLCDRGCRKGAIFGALLAGCIRPCSAAMRTDRPLSGQGLASFSRLRGPVARRRLLGSAHAYCCHGRVRRRAMLGCGPAPREQKGRTPERASSLRSGLGKTKPLQTGRPRGASLPVFFQRTIVRRLGPWGRRLLLD